MYYIKFGPDGYRINPVVPSYITDEKTKKDLLEKARNGGLANYKDYELVEEVTFEEISPEALKTYFEEEKKRVKEEKEKLWKEVVEPCLGKQFRRGDPLLEQITKYFPTRKRMEVIAEIENVYDVPKEDMLLFAKKIEEYKPKNDLVYLDNGKMHVDGYCDEEDIEVEYISYVMDVLLPIYPSEKELEKLAMQRTVYKHIGKAFRFDCEAIRDYMEGDLTFKGLMKKIDPRVERSC